MLLLVAAAIKTNAQDAPKNSTNIERFRIAVQGGSQLLAKTAYAVPTENKNYVSELKSGSHYGADVSYFVKPTWGLGIKFSQFKSANSGIMGGTDQIGNLVLLSKHTTAITKHTFVFAVAMGYLGYNNDAGIAGQPVKITGGTFGSALDADYDFNITKHFALGAQLSLTGGTLSRLNYTMGDVTNTQNFDDDQKESMSRLDFSLDARFNF